MGRSSGIQGSIIAMSNLSKALATTLPPRQMSSSWVRRCPWQPVPVMLSACCAWAVACPLIAAESTRSEPTRSSVAGLHFRGGRVTGIVDQGSLEAVLDAFSRAGSWKYRCRMDLRGREVSERFTDTPARVALDQILQPYSYVLEESTEGVLLELLVTGLKAEDSIPLGAGAISSDAAGQEMPPGVTVEQFQRPDDLFGGEVELSDVFAEEDPLKGPGSPWKGLGGGGRPNDPGDWPALLGDFPGWTGFGRSSEISKRVP